MEYLLVICAFAIMCACAFWAYGVLDAIEREEEDELFGLPAQRIRLDRRVLSARATEVTRHASGREPVPPAFGLEPRRERRWQGGSATAYADWLDVRLRDLEERVDLLARARLLVDQ